MKVMTEQHTEPLIPINRAYETLGDLVESWASKVSSDRVHIRTRDPLSVGTTVQLCFAIFLGVPHLVRGEGVVTQTNVHPAGGIEVKFTRLDDASKHLIDHVVRSARA